jgi:hypothetical protein
VRVPSRWVLVGCVQCGKRFERRVGEQARHPEAFCSRECYRANRAIGGRSVCLTCRRPFRRPGGGSYCSTTCYHESRRKG